MLNNQAFHDFTSRSHIENSRHVNSDEMRQKDRICERQDMCTRAVTDTGLIGHNFNTQLIMRKEKILVFLNIQKPHTWKQIDD